MRDLALALFLFGSVPFILRWPAIGVFLWVWISVMNPHRLTWGHAYSFRWGYLIALATLIGILFSREPKRFPITPVTAVLFMLVLWMNVTVLLAIDTSQSLLMWERVMKIMFMVFIALYLLHSKQHVQVLVWILAGSVAFFGVKGGLFTLREGGAFRVYGPTGSFIEENNALALAVIMTIPLLRFVHLQAKNHWVRWGLLVSMVLCGFSVLGSQSRGGFVAITAMVGFLWWKSRNKLVTGFVLALLIPVAIGFMPDQWAERMRSIQTYEQDDSAMGRINAWTMAINLTKERPIVGGGFGIYTPSVYARYAPNPDNVLSAHSIYFQILGEHGYVGLLLFLLLWILVWRDASWIISQARIRENLRWASNLASMIQVSLVGYAVGGAFLNLAYYDVPYNLLVVLVIARLLVEKEIRSMDPEKGFAMAPQVNADNAGNQRLESRTRLEPQIGRGPNEFRDY